MRLSAVLVAAGALAAGALLNAQFDPDRVIPGGGISVQGWAGKIDASSTRQGRTINDAKLSPEGNSLHVYGIRFTHNVEALITGLSMTKG